jgi:carbon storage regulator
VSLILTRRVGEKIMIGENIEVQILSIWHGQVRLGIAAPKDVPVDRKEVAERKARDPRPVA